MASVSSGKLSPQVPDAKTACMPIRVPNPFSSVKTSPPISDNWCITKMETINFSFIWKIEHFSLLKEKKGEYLQSSTFVAGRDNEFEWRLLAYPKGSTKAENEDYVSVFLKLVSCNPTEVVTKYEISILNDKCEKSYGASLEGKDRFTEGGLWGWKNFIELDFLQVYSLLPDDNLTILVEGTIGDVRTDISGLVDGFQDQADMTTRTLSEDFGSLFQNQKMSDVTLSVDNKNLLAHKLILAARSSVFAAMFEHEMKESQHNRVVIEDIDYEVLKEMLVYIYTGESPNINSLTRDLLVAADKYDVVGLKLLCQEVLCSTITIDNVLDLLEFGDRHCAEKLKVRVSHFIKSHVKDVICKPGWENMFLKYPYLFTEAFKGLACK